MLKLYENIISYLSYLNDDLKLNTSVHFASETLKRFSKEMWAGLSVYNSHRNLYCMEIKSTSRNKCIMEQRKIYESCTNEVAFFRICHSGVYEYILPICQKGKAVAFVSVSGFRGSEENGVLNRELWKKCLTDKTFFPEKLCNTVIPPLCHMLKKLFEYNEEGEANEYNAIIQFLNEYHNNIRLEDLCQRFSRSRSYISHMFRKTYGKSFSEFCNDLKLADAEKMLTVTEKSVTEIAFDAGFGDVSYFINMFKKRYGVTPLKYRKKDKVEGTV